MPSNHTRSGVLAFALLVTACAGRPGAAPAGALPGDAQGSIQGSAPGGARHVAAAPDAGRRVAAQNGAVTSANALASEAGIAVLRDGGNAVDAVVATAFAIGVVEPQMSGLGGSGSMTIWRQPEQAAYYLDFYAMQPVGSFRRQAAGAAPAAAAPEGMDLRVVAVPGAVAGLLMAHERFGRLPLARVMAPAIRLAEEGFPVGQVLARFIHSDSAKLHRFVDAQTRMWPGGAPLPPGATLRNPELARSLRAIAEQGRNGFYEGDVARAVVARMNASGHPVTLDDMATYSPVWKPPLCATYRGNIVLSAPPPQTGAQVLHTLKLLEGHDPAGSGLPTRSPQAFDLLVSALRVAMADNRGNNDPRWTRVPAHGRTTDAFAGLRSALVGTGSAAAAIQPADATAFDSNEPPAACAAIAAARVDTGSEPVGSAPAAAPANAPANAPAAAPAALGADPAAAESESGETTHISVVDADGSAVALTQTNSTTFGSGAWVEGFFLNDSGYLFDEASLEPGAGDAAWRTRTSTIAPTIVLSDGRVRLVTGAPGAGRIPTEIVQTMVYVLDYGMDPLEALRMPRIYPSATNASVQLEHGFPPELLRQVRALGYDPVAQSSSYARLYMIVRQDGRWIAVADPRHDGEPRGY